MLLESLINAAMIPITVPKTSVITVSSTVIIQPFSSMGSVLIITSMSNTFTPFTILTDRKLGFLG